MSNGFKNGLKKVGRVWHYKFKMHGELHHGSTRCESIQDARRVLDALRAEKAKQPFGLGEPPTVRALFDLYCEDKAAKIEPTSIQSFRTTVGRWVLPLIGSKRVDRLKQTDLADIVNTYQSTPAPNGKAHSKGGIKATLIATRTLLNYAVKANLIAKLPVKVQLPKLQQKPIQSVPSDQVKHFLSVVDAAEDPQLVLAVRTMLYMGLRISEVSGMRWEWFDHNWENYTPGKTKGKEADAIPVVPDLMKRFQAWKETTRITWEAKGKAMPEWVFWDKHGAPRSKSFTTKFVKDAAASAGLKGNWSPHKLRSSCATLLNEAGVPSFIIQKILRHKHIQTTLHYAKTDLKMMRAGLMKVAAFEEGEEPSEAPHEAPARPAPTTSDLEAIRRLIPQAVFERVVPPLLAVGMSEAEALAVAIRESMK
jgi:integrase